MENRIARGGKLGYEDWARGVKDPLQRAHRGGLSWTQISMKLGKGTRGWAERATLHRSICTEQDIQRIQSILAPYLNHREEPMETFLANGSRKLFGETVGPALTQEQMQEVCDWIDYLRASRALEDTVWPGYTMSAISRICGLHESAVAGIRNRDKGRTSLKVYNRLKKLHFLVENGVYPKDGENVNDYNEIPFVLPVEHKEEPTPEPVQPKPTATVAEWRTEVRDLLLKAAEVILAAAPTGLPARYRAPYEEEAEQIMEMAQGFQTV